MKWADEKIMVWLGLEPGTFRTTQTRKRRSHHLSLELAQINNKSRYQTTSTCNICKLLYFNKRFGSFYTRIWLQ